MVGVTDVVLPSATLRYQGDDRGPQPDGDWMCVCGDMRSEHHTTVLSVPLKYRPPVYGMPTNAPIAEPAFGATPDVEQCHCGCTIPTKYTCGFLMLVPRPGKPGISDEKPCRRDPGHKGEHEP